MIALAVGLGVLGIFALRRARGRCYAGNYGWYGPWADYGRYGDDVDDLDGDDEHGPPHARGPHPHRWHGGPPWMRRGRRGGWSRGRRGRRGRWMLHAMLSRIDATPAQERVIVGEIDRLQDRVRDARSGLRDARGDLSAALRGPLLDDAALGAVLGRFDGATGEVRLAVLDALRNIHAVLDDKQRVIVADFIERRAGGGGGGGRAVRMGPYR